MVGSGNVKVPGLGFKTNQSFCPLRICFNHPASPRRQWNNWVLTHKLSHTQASSVSARWHQSTVKGGRIYDLFFKIHSAFGMLGYKPSLWQQQIKLNSEFSSNIFFFTQSLSTMVITIPLFSLLRPKKLKLFLASFFFWHSTFEPPDSPVCSTFKIYLHYNHLSRLLINLVQATTSSCLECGNSLPNGLRVY